jgi:choline dehydrogenase-like flavoprotein
MNAPDVIIVGSGPAGVSAAWPLVEAGIDVLMIDAAGGGAHPASPSGTIGEFRRAPDRWRMQFGPTLAGLSSAADLSPKLNTPLARSMLAGYAAANRLSTQRFHAFGSLGLGGLSNIWGAMTPRFDADDLADFPITTDDLEPSTRAVMARIGAGEPGPPLTAAAQRLFDRYHGSKSDKLPKIERATNAVLMTDRPGRQGCASCGLCLWGCDRRSIYNSAYELPDLLRRPNFSYRSGLIARAIEPDPIGHALLADGAILRAPRIIVAAGTIATTALIAGRLGLWDTDIRLLTNPVAATAFLLPSLVGAALPERSFSLAQLRWELPLPDGGTANGAIYGGDTLPLTEVASRIPLSRPTALRISRALAPALLFATIYLPGRFSANTMRVRRDGVAIEGRITDEARAALREVRGRLARAGRELGAFPMPKSFTVSEAGADAHYAGTIPMGGAGTLACSADGEVCPGLYVADGSALSALPAKHCTLTIMANADRIARRVAVLTPAPAPLAAR